jgi:Trk K+ transport system NAD-binding subunit
MRIANAIARPAVVDFLNLVLPGFRGEEFSLEEVRVLAQSPLAGKTVAALEHEHERVRIVALKRGADAISLIPGPQVEVQAGDLLIAIGARLSLRRLAESP